MIRIIPLLAILFSFQSFAVETKKCLPAINIEIADVQIFSKNFIYNQLEDQDYVDYESIDSFIAGSFDGLKADLVLSSTANSTCNYTAEMSEPETYVNFVISGSDEDTYMSLYYSGPNGDFSFFTRPTSKSPYYEVTGAVFQIKAYSSQKVWDANVVKYIAIGKAVAK